MSLIAIKLTLAGYAEPSPIYLLPEHIGPVRPTASGQGSLVTVLDAGGWAIEVEETPEQVLALRGVDELRFWDGAA